jgi:hypothetical protein
MYKIGVISPPSIYTGGHGLENQLPEIRSVFVSFLEMTKELNDDNQVYLDTFYPLSQSIANLSMSQHVPVTRVQSFKPSRKDFKKIPTSYEQLLRINETCSGLIIANAGKYTPKKMDKAMKLIAKQSDFTFVIGPSWYEEYASLAKNSTFIETPLPKDILRDL